MFVSLLMCVWFGLGSMMPVDLERIGPPDPLPGYEFVGIIELNGDPHWLFIEIEGPGWYAVRVDVASAEVCGRESQSVSREEGEMFQPPPLIPALTAP